MRTVGRSVTSREYLLTPVVIGAMVFALTLSSVVAFAGVTATIVHVQVSTDTDVGGVEYYFPGGTEIESEYQWFLPAPVPIFGADGTTLLGTVEGLSVAVKADPAVDLSFDVVAGAAKTYFDIRSTTVSFCLLYTSPSPRDS